MTFSSKALNKLFQRHYDGYRYMAKRHPKAAKKLRIQKKWRNRFGPEFAQMVYGSETMLFRFEKEAEFGGRTVRVPL
jgi:hypothetical protein